MELSATFSDFLKDTVNLNATRIQQLEDSVDAIKKFVRQCDWGPVVLGFDEQGSWAHDTIIRPVDKGEFDADLLVRVEPVDGWTAKDYITELKRAFKSSSTYKRKVKAHDYCVTITYANDKKIDVAPLVVGRQTAGELEVCNRKTNEFERSEPEQYTDWLIEQNGYSGGNSFRKVTRLIKYLRDIKTRFVCPSVLLTTLLASQIAADDKDTDEFKNVPCTLKTVMGRLDDWLQDHAAKPEVCNPFLPSEDFAASWTDAQYASFRNSISKYRGWIDQAFAEPDRDKSVEAWRKLFGEAFAPSVVVAKAAVDEGRFALAEPLAKAANAISDLVAAVRVFGARAIPKNYAHLPHMTAPTWAERDDVDSEVIITATVGGGRHHMTSRPVASGQILHAGPSIYFEALQPDGRSLGPEYRVEWRITNAPGSPQPRGGFYPADNAHARVEQLQYRGVHVAEVFVVRRSDSVLAGISDPFYVAID
ncbi:SMODS domain-containing nucleotidyltransferase [Brevundimonas sp.]|uniref:SMODS domain-containing nucleotidyltransferase n=1 Tax=Brevundimonas sp. TaxID=1871086 RepID=UPI00286CE8A8|nr:hypothetical protein [Brevundimonas sp.]